MEIGILFCALTLGEMRQKGKLHFHYYHAARKHALSPFSIIENVKNTHNSGAYAIGQVTLEGGDGMLPSLPTSAPIGYYGCEISEISEIREAAKEMF